MIHFLCIVGTADSPWATSLSSLQGEAYVMPGAVHEAPSLHWRVQGFLWHLRNLDLVLEFIAI